MAGNSFAFSFAWVEIKLAAFSASFSPTFDKFDFAKFNNSSARVWSVNPSATINRYVSLISIVTVCLAFTLLGWNRTRFQDVVRPVLTVLLIASVIFGLLYPQYAIEVGEDAVWRGCERPRHRVS